MNTIGKISVRFFLNINVNPKYEPLFGDTKFYPLYIQVTFRRKNTQFRSFYEQEYIRINDAFNRDHENLKYEEYIIKQIVQYEVKTKGEKFQLKGLKVKYKIYTAKVDFIVKVFLRDTMSTSLEQSTSKYKLIMNPERHWEVPLEIYYAAAFRLINNFEALLPKNFKRDMADGEEFIKWCEEKKDPPRLIAWLDQTLMQEYKIFLKSKANSDNQISDKLNLIKRAITYNEDNMF